MNWSIEDFVYGAIDGAVTTFAVVAGIVGGITFSISCSDFRVCKLVCRWFCNGDR
ncbi:VIT1/CCC1 transporter family protein [Candidatus Nitrosocosmicus arcticus]|uniref:Uncharacterized protein n=1 Tax=Candidatus Nitrosocosmicus arcticus TaxID=2035267 RepID=A0A557SSU7_9ARCH|nr:VIT1/CCC1 transporter family protein [Candidatus Nitrosocosmicus arcticus]TVP39683.1 hypothetical protein NARC_130022 [Candidatus Nitrosocosmicus arcticus]